MKEIKLTVNKKKSKVSRPWKLKFLGYSFYYVKGEINFKVHEKSIKKLKEKLKYLSGRSRIGNIKASYVKTKTSNSSMD